MLSDTAQGRRRRDMIDMSVTAKEYIYIISVGIKILARRMNKLTRKQKVILAFASTTSVAVLVYLFVTQGAIAWVFLLMFLLGIILAEIRHL